MRYARYQYQGATFEVGDLRDFSLRENVDAVICLDSSLLLYCHTDRELESCLSSCPCHLRDGGLLVAERYSTVPSSSVTPNYSMAPPTRVLLLARCHLARRDRTVDRPRPPVVASSQTLGASDRSGDLVQTSAWRTCSPPSSQATCTAQAFESERCSTPPDPRRAAGRQVLQWC